jgi:hypothetical protein
MSHTSPTGRLDLRIRRMEQQLRLLKYSGGPALRAGHHPCASSQASVCTRHARTCPESTSGGLRLTELKSDKSRRTISLSPLLVATLRAHRAAQLEERMTAGPAWDDSGFVWCQPNERPIGAHADWDEWRALLKAAGIRDAGCMTPGIPLSPSCLPRCRPACGHGDPWAFVDQHDHQVRAGHDRCGRPDRPGALGLARECHERSPERCHQRRLMNWVTREPNCNPNCNPGRPIAWVRW